MFMKDESGQTLADYYARIMTFLVNGSMTDEHGQVSMTPQHGNSSTISDISPLPTLRTAQRRAHSLERPDRLRCEQSCPSGSGAQWRSQVRHVV
jgi:hypothetical protein